MDFKESRCNIIIEKFRYYDSYVPPTKLSSMTAPVQERELMFMAQKFVTTVSHRS